MGENGKMFVAFFVFLFCWMCILIVMASFACKIWTDPPDIVIFGSWVVSFVIAVVLLPFMREHR